MKSKPIFLAMVGVGAIAFSLLSPVLSTGQTISASQTDPKSVTALLQDVQAQQKAIAENQAKIDEKQAAIVENLRQARIYVSRGGR